MISYEEIADRLAYLLYQLIEGDNQSGSVFEALYDYGYVDENHEWIYDE